MADMDRREFNTILGAAGLTVAAQTLGAPALLAKTKGHVVIIGGGAGGATAAHALKKEDADIDVTLIDASKSYTSCFFSNLYLGGYRSLESLTHSYSGLTHLGVKVVHGLAVNVDTSAKTIALQEGDPLKYDKLVIAPGIDFEVGFG